MNPDPVERLVREQLGLDPEALGETALPRAIDRRMRATANATVDTYAAFVSRDQNEQRSLVDELVVPETWFFRGGRILFDTLARSIAERAKVRTADCPIRLLCIPCSTGEEPYSLAMALRDQNVPATLVQIHGVDISPSHLRRAEVASYSSFAFRESGLDYQTKYFHQSGDRWLFDPELRSSVRFTIGNSADADFLAGESPFDLILCRNLFIYLTAEARRSVLANLDRLLAPNGWLVLSPAEADRLPPQKFVAIDRPEFGIYRRAASGEMPAQRSEIVPRQSRRRGIQTVTTNTTSSHQPPTSTVQKAIDTATTVPTIAIARGLADSGRLMEARAACEKLLQSTADNADAHSLLGVILLGEGQVNEAAESLRKALYLDPNHEEALSHMIVICDRRSDTAQATALRKRLQRLAKREAK